MGKFKYVLKKRIYGSKRFSAIKTDEEILKRSKVVYLKLKISITNKQIEF